jgi:hypothetical protein
MGIGLFPALGMIVALFYIWLPGWLFFWRQVLVL